MLLVSDVMLFAVELVLLGHRQLLGGYKVECGVEMAHGSYEGMDRAAIFQVTDQIDVEVFKSTLGLVYLIEVEQTLGRVHVGAISSINNRYWCYFACIKCSSFYRVAHGNHVGIVGYHKNGVFKSFALCCT